MKKWATTYLATMKLVTNETLVQDLLAEIMLEYNILEANPFDAAKEDESGGDEGGEAEGGDGEAKEEEGDKKGAEGSDALKVKFDPSAVKKYNSNTDWRSGEGDVKKISKKGLEVSVDGNSIIVNFDDISEHAANFFNNTIIKEEDAGALDPDDKKEMADLEAAMGAAAKEMGAAFDAAQEDIEKEVEEMPEEELNERKKALNEELTTIAVIGFIMALPKLVEIIAKGVDKLVKLLRKITKINPPKTEDERSKAAAAVIDFTHKWHNMYIKAFYYMLKFSGLYKKAGIKGQTQQMKVAKILYYTVVAALAVSAGIGAIGAFKAGVSNAAHGGEFALGTFESAMSLVKSGEVMEFISALGAPAADSISAATG